MCGWMWGRRRCRIWNLWRYRGSRARNQVFGRVSYSACREAGGARHATWVCTPELPAPEPWHMLPVAIMVTMLLMEPMTRQAAMDPAQQKMINIMIPGMLGLMSCTLPAGLGLYWSAGQLIGIVQ